MPIPAFSAKDIIRGSRAFQRHDRRDAMYRVATFLVEHFNDKPEKLADALGVLLLTWNGAFYRYGPFAFADLEDVIQNNLKKLKTFRTRHVASFSESDKMPIKRVFESFLDALAISEGPSKGKKSPVSVAKALHLLAPSFFPLWDCKIANAYGCNYASNPGERYLHFMGICKGQSRLLENYQFATGTTVLKFIDEFNYAKFTKGWV